MIGNRVRVRFIDSDDPIDGELRKQSPEGVWLYYGWAENAALHFFPQNRIKEIEDRGPIYR